MAGDARYDALELARNDLDVSVHGDAKVHVQVARRPKVSVFGDAYVGYTGDRQVSPRVFGQSRIEALGR